MYSMSSGEKVFVAKAFVPIVRGCCVGFKLAALNELRELGIEVGIMLSALRIEERLHDSVV
jgi:hypothetical protein